MWLLNTTALQLRSFVIDIPDYAILSHTWGAEEVTFDDVGKPHAPSMAGYGKLVGCCQLAVKNGFDWAWIDTCCIDKKSSAELSEAINSMYKWYWNAVICYAYLADVSAASPAWKQEIEVSRWFKRGWTLQELLAPEALEFYDSRWQPLGTRSKLISRIQKATRIQPRFLMNRKTIKNASVATKFSWAADRETTRAEDMAYCLLGLVEVNMPMLYGEGDRAFYRLQLEILRQTNEHSIFAWESPGMAHSMTGVLAHSPACYKNSATIHPTASRRAETVAHEVTNYGLRITLPCFSAQAEGGHFFALLSCEREKSANVGILLQILGPGRFGRVPGSQLVTFDQAEEKTAELLSMYLVVKNDHDDFPESPAVRMVVSSVLANRPFDVEAFAVSNMRKSPKLALWSGENVASYVIDVLSIVEGEAANMQLVCRSLPYKRQSYNIIFGIRGGQAMVRCIDTEHRLRDQKHLTAIQQDWSTDMCLDPSGEWESRGDYEQVLTQDKSIVQLSARRDITNKERVWDLAIQIFQCHCGSSDSSGEDCICDVHNKNKIHSECSAVDSVSADCICYAYAVSTGHWHMIGTYKGGRAEN